MKESAQKPQAGEADQIADLYSAFADSYVKYADGEAEEDLFSFSSQLYGEEDQRLFNTITSEVLKCVKRNPSTSCLRLLDAGCGPGTWPLRIAAFCHKQGIPIKIVGVDISSEMIHRANAGLSAAKGKYQDVNFDIEFKYGDISIDLPYGNNSFDISLSLYTVLNHVDRATVGFSVGEMMRVTSSVNITTVRTLGSMPTAFVSFLKDFSAYEWHDDVLTLWRGDGQTATLYSHLFSGREITDIFAKHGRIVDSFGLGIFGPRFRPDQAWGDMESLPEFEELQAHLRQLDEIFCRHPTWREFANHLVLVSAPFDQRQAQVQRLRGVAAQ
jgi:ubiquinone/menaquinone biosynthesis C-methylase UbiE